MCESRLSRLVMGEVTLGRWLVRVRAGRIAQSCNGCSANMNRTLPAFRLLGRGVF
jgi:hypothetical protein